MLWCLPAFFSFLVNSMSLCELSISGKHRSALSASVSAVRKGLPGMLGFQSSSVPLTLTSNSVLTKIKFCHVYCKLNGHSAVRVMRI